MNRLREETEYLYPEAQYLVNSVIYDVRGGHSIDFDPTNCENNQPNGLISHPDPNTTGGFNGVGSIALHDYIKVVHLVNAGFVNLDFLKTQLFNKFGLETFSSL